MAKSPIIKTMKIAQNSLNIIMSAIAREKALNAAKSRSFTKLILFVLKYLFNFNLSYSQIRKHKYLLC